MFLRQFDPTGWGLDFQIIDVLTCPTDTRLKLLKSFSVGLVVDHGSLQSDDILPSWVGLLARKIKLGFGLNSVETSWENWNV